MTGSKAAAGGATTPMMKQYLSIKKGYPDCILFFRMGDFYEMFMDDAVRAADILKIALTTRDKGKENAVPMCGVPYHAAESYITRLVKAGLKVAVCDQVEDPSRARGLVKRAVTRVVTPGTAVEESLLEAVEPAYLAAVKRSGDRYGAALVDVSTGEFLTAETGAGAARDDLALIMARYPPREILLPEEDGEGHSFGAHVTRIEPYRFDNGAAAELLAGFYGVRTLHGFGLEDDHLAVGAAGAALWYLKEVHTGDLAHLRPPRKVGTGSNLVLDANTLANLEILRSTHDKSTKDTLIGVMDRTVTAMGARRLRQAVVSPLRDTDGIDARLELVQELVDDPVTRDGIREKLRKLSDMERILSRISSGSAGPRDLVALRDTLERIPGLRELSGNLVSDLGEGIHGRIDAMEELVSQLKAAVADDPPNALKEGGVIRDGYDPGLDEVRSMAGDGRCYISQLETTERDLTGIPSLKVGFNRVFGYYLEVTNTHKELVPDRYIRKQTLVNAERYITEELKVTEEKILASQERMAALERELFQSLCAAVLAFTALIQETAGALADADMFAALAELAHTSGYCRPVILAGDPERRISISEGRHPVLEKSPVIESFVPNDTYLDQGENRMMILTGPNMAGKSTYMRQIALIVIMAQTGSFVPAREALIAPVDRIFTRVGASDALSRGLSTFMVEMVETAEILTGATADSLVVLDEIGRGTSTFDGISIAWAVAEFLLDGPPQGCRTTFATHYHELTELALTRPGVRNFNVAIREWGERLIFLHRVQEGPADKSYGIQVGRLAGLPPDVVKRARTILANLEKHALDRDGQPVLVSAGGETADAGLPSGTDQMGLFAPDAFDLVARLRNSDIESMTPLDALNLLAELKRRYT